MEPPASVVVTEERNSALRTEQRFEKLGHSLDARVQRAGEYRMEHEHVQRVDMIVAGLLEMSSISANLTLKLVVDPPTPLLDPALRCGELREAPADRMQR